jgi:hypothetical protein
MNSNAAGTMTITCDKLDFIDIHAGEGSSFQFNAYVAAAGTKAWCINMKYDYFKLDDSTTNIIPVSAATYRILNNLNETHATFLPFNMTTVYTSTYTSQVTTVTFSINLSPGMGIKTGIYRSNLQLELGDLI